MTDKRLRDDVKGVINAVQLQLDGRQGDAPDDVGLVASFFPPTCTELVSHYS